MKIRIALLLMLAVLAVPMAILAAQAPVDPQSTISEVTDAVTPVDADASSRCLSSSDERSQSVIAAPLETIVADGCDSTCDTQEECEQFCGGLAHCQLLIHCCVCF